MAKVTQYDPGTFCWPELATDDCAGAKKFYERLFGWDSSEQDVGDGVIYAMLRLGGDSVGAMYGINKEMLAAGVPPHWASYVSVESADETFAKAKSLGAVPMVEPMDVFDAGRMAMLADPVGAAFALWQPEAHIGAGRVNEPGTLCWNELLTSDTDRSGSFYTNLFAWSAQTQKMGPIGYTSFMNGERPAGGMMEIQKEWGEVPPNWLVYFAVVDCDASAAEAAKTGGMILAGPEDVPNVGRFAAIHDPQGATFSIIQLANPVD